MPRERRLAWEGCVNVRDLGGHATEDGRTTRFGAVVRADSVGRLTASGWQALAGHGVIRIVDLRDEAEATEDGVLEAPVEVVRIPLLDGLDAESYADARARAAATDDAARAKATSTPSLSTVPEALRRRAPSTRRRAAGRRGRPLRRGQDRTVSSPRSFSACAG